MQKRQPKAGVFALAPSLTESLSADKVRRSFLKEAEVDQATKDRLNQLLQTIVAKTKSGDLPPDMVEEALGLIAKGDFRDIQTRRWKRHCTLRARARNELC